MVPKKKAFHCLSKKGVSKMKDRGSSGPTFDLKKKKKKTLASYLKPSKGISGQIQKPFRTEIRQPSYRRLLGTRNAMVKRSTCLENPYSGQSHVTNKWPRSHGEKKKNLPAYPR